MPEIRQTLTPQKNGRSVVFIRTLTSDSAALAQGAQPQPSEIPLSEVAREATEDAPRSTSSHLSRQLLMLLIVLSICGALYIFFWPV